MWSGPPHSPRPLIAKIPGICSSDSVLRILQFMKNVIYYRKISFNPVQHKVPMGQEMNFPIPERIQARIIIIHTSPSYQKSLHLHPEPFPDSHVLLTFQVSAEFLLQTLRHMDLQKFF